MTSKNKITKQLKKFIANEQAEVQKLLVMPILAILALFIVATLGMSVIPQAITTSSDTGNISGYAANWTTSTKSTFSTIPTFLALGFFLVIVAIVIYLIVHMTD